MSMSRAMSRHMTLPMFRRRLPEVALEPAPIPVPRFSIDGWTFDGTPEMARLAGLPRADVRELETLLHEVASQADTPYTYERAAVLLERAGEAGPAMSVCEAWLAHPAAGWPEYAASTRNLERHRARLRSRLSAPTGGR
jgi:hypothetical protein